MYGILGHWESASNNGLRAWHSNDDSRNDSTVSKSKLEITIKCKNNYIYLWNSTRPNYFDAVSQKVEILSQLKYSFYSQALLVTFRWSSSPRALSSSTSRDTKVTCESGNRLFWLKGLCQLESMRSEVMQITFNCQNSIVFNAWLSPCSFTRSRKRWYFCTAAHHRIWNWRANS